MNAMNRGGKSTVGVALLLAVLAAFAASDGPVRDWLVKMLWAGGVLLLLGLAWSVWRERARERYLRAFEFPAGLSRKLLAAYPHLSREQAETVIRELRTFFRVARAAKGGMVSMPSQAVDVAWHEFILFTRGYRQFCARSLGRFLDHTPAEHMATPVSAQQGLRRTWLHACRLEGIDPRRPDRLPMLFALDGLLQIPDGFRYALDCSQGEGVQGFGVYCASDIGCGGSCVADGLGDSAHGHGHGDGGGCDGGSSDGGGDSGSSCGGD